LLRHEVEDLRENVIAIIIAGLDEKLRAVVCTKEQKIYFFNIECFDLNIG
jgi:hypothetical protein